MFTLVQWDSPLALVMELALSVMVIAGIMFAARLANARSQPPPNDTESSHGEKDQ